MPKQDYNSIQTLLNLHGKDKFLELMNGYVDPSRRVDLKHGKVSKIRPKRMAVDTDD